MIRTSQPTNAQAPVKPIWVCARPGCGAPHDGDHHVCRNPAK